MEHQSTKTNLESQTISTNSGTYELFLGLRVGNWLAPSVSACKGIEIHVV